LDGPDAGFECVQSFAIVNTKITDDMVQYWLDKKSEYPVGGMKAAYGTFLTSLSMIKCHDMVADPAAAQYNVTWTCTAPSVVSVFDDACDGHMTLECGYRFGMDVNGDTRNIAAFLMLVHQPLIL